MCVRACSNREIYFYWNLSQVGTPYCRRTGGGERDGARCGRITMRGTTRVFSLYKYTYTRIILYDAATVDITQRTRVVIAAVRFIVIKYIYNEKNLLLHSGVQHFESVGPPALWRTTSGYQRWRVRSTFPYMGRGISEYNFIGINKIIECIVQFCAYRPSVSIAGPRLVRSPFVLHGNQTTSAISKKK